MNRLIVWVAQGFGSGCVPYGPGTFGSVVGFGWFLLLLWSGNWAWFTLGLLAGAIGSVWLCGKAEKILHEQDPGSVVLDEIVAMPLCFVGWMVLRWKEGMPAFLSSHFLSGSGLTFAILVFVLFRVFDIAKPWPVGRSQKLPGGWGVTMDDLLAAVYVNLVVLLLWRVKPGWVL